MKPSRLAVLVLAALGVSTVAAQDAARRVGMFQNATIEQTEKSLVWALESNCPGLEVSAALTVRDLKALMPERSFSCFVIPLMRIVKRDDAEDCSRVVAALALHDLHSAIGDFAISRAAKFTDCSKLARTCRWLTYYQMLEDHPELAPPQAAGVLAERVDISR